MPDPEKCFEAREAVVATWARVEGWVVRTIDNESLPPNQRRIKAVAYPHVLTAQGFLDTLLPGTTSPDHEPAATLADAIDVYHVLQSVYRAGLVKISEQHGVDPARLMVTTDLRKELSPEEAELERERTSVIGSMASYYAIKVEEHVGNLFRATMQS